MTEETIHNEWHRSPENKAILEELIKRVYEPDSVLIAHHICYEKNGETHEIASAETFLFDPCVMEKLFGTGWQAGITGLALVEPSERLNHLALQLSI